MASTPVRVIARNSKLTHPTTRLTTTRLSHNRQALPCLQPAYSVRSCILPQRQCLGGRSQYSTVVEPCTLAPSHANSGILRRSTFNQTSHNLQRFQLGVNQKRFSSKQSLDPAETHKTGPLSTTKVTAPTILQQALKPTKHENIYTIPNILTFSRLLAAPAVGYFILHSQPVAALGLFFYAGVTDLVDGYLARRYNSQTVVGTIIDPMADKTLMTIAVVCLGVQGVIPVWLAVIILGRDVGLAISACYYRYISLPPPKTFARYWDFSLPSAEVRPTEISKINTLLQLLLIGDALVLPVLPAAWVDAWNLVGVFEGWQYLVAATTVWSGLSYVFSNDAVKILSQAEKS